MATDKDSKNKPEIQRPRLSWGKVMHIASKVLLIVVLGTVIISMILVPLLSVL